MKRKEETCAYGGITVGCTRDTLMDRDGGKEDIRMYVIRASFHLEFDSYVQE